jgi:hypothetical protein
MPASVVATTNGRQTLVLVGIMNSHLFESFRYMPKMLHIIWDTCFLSVSQFFLKLFAKIRIVLFALFSPMHRLGDKYKRSHTNF